MAGEYSATVSSRGLDQAPPSSGLRRLVVVLLNLLLVGSLVLFFALPGPQERSYPQREPVRFWHMWSGEWKDVVDGIAAEFNKSQDKYEVIALSVPGASADYKFLLAVAGGDPPDCMAQWNQVIPAWADQGMLVPLDTLMSPAEWQDFQASAYPVALKIGCYKGHLYGVTTGINIWGCYYNPAHLRDAGLDPDNFPTDLDEVWAWGQKLNRYDENGNLTRMGFLPGWCQMYVPVFGGSFYDPGADQVTIYTPANLHALTWLADKHKELGYDKVVRFQSMLNTGGFSTEWPFISGQYSITVDGQWRVEQLAKYAPDLKYRTAPIPPPKGGKPLAGWSNGNFMIIPKGARHVAGAWEFIKFWSGVENPERAAKFYTRGGWLPLSPKIARAPVYQEYLRKYPQFKTFLDVLPSENIQTSAPVPYQVFLGDMIGRADDFAMRGTLAPAQALKDLERNVAQEIERRRRFGL
ncbi:MAG: ABC transporter substrate-binding protein [Planctomycetota bacterium]|nr:ABC transporter substrate-binding protein [Planctomycetota bacterium]